MYPKASTIAISNRKLLSSLIQSGTLLRLSTSIRYNKPSSISYSNISTRNINYRKMSSTSNPNSNSTSNNSSQSSFNSSNSTSSGTSSNNYSDSGFHPYVDSTLQQIDNLAPKFAIDSSNISILSQPSEFYTLLKEKILNAKKRIFLSTLYIGKTEHELIDCIDEALAKNPDVEVYILTDALRGTREQPESCSASLLVPLVSKYGPRVSISMYHTPNLYGVRKTFIPQRFNEGWGLQHMKLYGFDDEIILSGANLSNDYFTNRQDRYILFEDEKLTEYFFKVYETVAGLSYSVIPVDTTKSGFKLRWPHYYSAPEPTVDPVNFIKAASRKLKPLLGPQNSPVREEEEKKQNMTTFVYPICQFTQLLIPDTSTEFDVISRVLSMIGSGRFDWTLTAGYFNIHPEFKEKLLKTKPNTHASIITASPEANGFYKSAGVSGLLPGAYSLLAKEFLQAAHDSPSLYGGKTNRLKFYEWQNGVVNEPNGWSYHAKGIWISQPGESEPFMSVIGSSNYTRRAYSHDLEANVLLVTSDSKLKSQLGKEVENLKTHTKEMELKDYDVPERQPDWRQRAFIHYAGDKL